MAHVMAVTPAEARHRPRLPHHLDWNAWRAVPVDTPATLDYFMADYVGHLRYHLRQVLGDAWDR